MTPEQQNKLFQLIGELTAQQGATLNAVNDLKEDINERIDRSEQANREREQEILALLRDLKAELLRAIDEKNAPVIEKISEIEGRVGALEEKMTNMRIKQAGYGGAAGTLVYLIAELLKTTGGQ